MISIEPISLRKGGWRNTDGFLNDLRHLDPQLGVVIFYGVVTAMMFFLYWRKYKSVTIAGIYTTSSLTMLAISLSAAFGIDILSALGSTLLPH